MQIHKYICRQIGGGVGGDDFRNCDGNNGGVGECLKQKKEL